MRVAVAENPMTAQLLSELLEQAGIRSLIKNRGAAPAIYGTGVLASYEVFVLEGDADAATRVIGDDLPSRPEQLPGAGS